jgi:hypothetical protein
MLYGKICNQKQRKKRLRVEWRVYNVRKVGEGVEEREWPELGRGRKGTRG